MIQQENKPWWKKHPLATAALGTAGLAGGGLLADKLLNEGKLTSQIFNSAKPAEAPKVIPQTQQNYKPDWADAANKWGDGINAIGSKDNQGNYAAPSTPDAFDRVAGPAAGYTLLGGAGSAVGSMLPGAAGQLSKTVGKALQPASMVAGPVMDYESWKNDSPLWRKAVSEYYGVQDDTAGKLLGATGGATSAATNWLTRKIPVVGPAASAAIMTVPTFVETALNNSERDLHYSNEAGKFYDTLGRQLQQASASNNLPEIKYILQRYPELKDNLNLDNMPQRARMFQEAQSKIQ
jgi:hypothetical protein